MFIKVTVCLLLLAVLVPGTASAQVGRAAVKVPMYLETFQVRRGSLFGAQGHSGHAIFPSVIRMMGSGLIDNAKIVTSNYPLDQAVDAIAKSTSRADGKIIVRP